MKKNNIDFDLANYIYKKIICHNYKGDLLIELNEKEINDLFYNDVKIYYDDKIKKPAFNRIIKAFKKIVESKEIKFYNDEIQLNDDRTLWLLNNDVVIDWDGFQLIASDFLDSFTIDTGIDVFQDGRSGRHIVIENNIKNFINSLEYRKIILKLQNDLIKYINKNYKGE